MAIREFYTNAAEIDLDEALDASETAIDVVDGSSLPLANFRVRVEDEIMYCTSRSGNTLTVIRGSESTTAATHTSAMKLNHVITAGALDSIKEDLYAIMGFGRRPTSGNTYGDEFDDETFSGWTAVNSGSAPLFTATEQDKMLSLLHPGGGASGQWLSYMKDTGGTLSVGNTIEVCFRVGGTSSGFPQLTLWMANGQTYGAGIQTGFAYSPNENTWVNRGSTNYNNQTSFTSTGGGVLISAANAYDWHMRMEWRGSNQWHGYSSTDGISWAKIFNNVTPTTITPRYIGFGFTTWGGSIPTICTVRSFRTNF